MRGPKSIEKINETAVFIRQNAYNCANALFQSLCFDRFASCKPLFSSKSQVNTVNSRCFQVLPVAVEFIGQDKLNGEFFLWNPVNQVCFHRSSILSALSELNYFLEQSKKWIGRRIFHLLLSKHETFQQYSTVRLVLWRF